LQSQRKNPSLQLGLFDVVFVVVEKEAILENLACAEYVSGKWPIEERYLELKNQVGSFHLSI
jgi:hypothetical protein